ALGDGTRVAVVALHVGGFDHVASKNECGFLAEGVDAGGGHFGHEHHVRCLDALPAGNRRTIEHHPAFQPFFIHSVCRHREVVFLAKGIGETEVDERHFVVGNHLEYVFGGGHKGSWTSCA